MTDGMAQVEEIRLGGMLGGLCLRFLVDGPTSGASLTMFEMEVAPGAAMPVPHHHAGFDETVYGVAGRVRFMVDGKTVELGAGDSLMIPRGAVHAFANPSAEPAKVLCVITPGVFGAPYFRDVQALLAAGGPPDPKAAAAVMLKHGLVPVAPA